MFSINNLKGLYISFSGDDDEQPRKAAPRIRRRTIEYPIQERGNNMAGPQHAEQGKAGQVSRGRCDRAVVGRLVFIVIIH